MIAEHIFYQIACCENYFQSNFQTFKHNTASFCSHKLYVMTGDKLNFIIQITEMESTNDTDTSWKNDALVIFMLCCIDVLYLQSNNVLNILYVK